QDRGERRHKFEQAFRRTLLQFPSDGPGPSEGMVVELIRELQQPRLGSISNPFHGLRTVAPLTAVVLSRTLCPRLRKVPPRCWACRLNVPLRRPSPALSDLR